MSDKPPKAKRKKLPYPRIEPGWREKIPEGWVEGEKCPLVPWWLEGVGLDLYDNPEYSENLSDMHSSCAGFAMICRCAWEDLGERIEKILTRHKHSLPYGWNIRWEKLNTLKVSCRANALAWKAYQRGEREPKPKGEAKCQK